MSVAEAKKVFSEIFRELFTDIYDVSRAHRDWRNEGKPGNKANYDTAVDAFCSAANENLENKLAELKVRQKSGIIEESRNLIEKVCEYATKYVAASIIVLRDEEENQKRIQEKQAAVDGIRDNIIDSITEIIERFDFDTEYGGGMVDEVYEKIGQDQNRIVEMAKSLGFNANKKEDGRGVG